MWGKEALGTQVPCAACAMGGRGTSWRTWPTARCEGKVWSVEGKCGAREPLGRKCRVLCVQWGDRVHFGAHGQLPGVKGKCGARKPLGQRCRDQGRFFQSPISPPDSYSHSSPAQHKTSAPLPYLQHSSHHPPLSWLCMQSMIRAFVLGGDFHSRTAFGMYEHIQEAVKSGEADGNDSVICYSKAG